MTIIKIMIMKLIIKIRILVIITLVVIPIIKNLNKKRKSIRTAGNWQNCYPIIVTITVVFNCCILLF